MYQCLEMRNLDIMSYMGGHRALVHGDEKYVKEIMSIFTFLDLLNL